MGSIRSIEPDQVFFLTKNNKEELHPWRYPSILNINAYLSHDIFKHCLIVLDDSRQVNLINAAINQTSSFMIRSHSPLSLTQLSGGKQSKVVFAPNNFVSKNITIMNGTSCPSSIFLVSSLPQKFICFLLDFKILWKRIKPFNCRVSLNLFPSTFFYEVYREILVDRLYYTQFYHIFPSFPQPTFHIFVHEVPPITPLEWKSGPRQGKTIVSLLKKKIVMFNLIQEFCQMVFLHFSVNYTSLGNQFPSEGTIQEIEILRICPHWGLQETLIVPLSNLTSYQHIFNLSIIPVDANFAWEIPQADLGDNVIGRSLQKMRQCSTLAQISHKSQNQSLLDMVALGFAHIWFGIMDNYTVVRDTIYVECSTNFGQSRNNRLTTAVVLHFKPFVSGLNIFPYFAKIDLNNLRFVSCGRQLSSLPFQELTNIFDEWIWLLTLISIIVVMIPLQTLSEKHIGLWTHWMGTIKVLLEQGDPFPNKVANQKVMRYVIGIFLLAGIVLSNGYKNSNVYNMIVPRKPIPYERFHELVDHDFIVYTRVISLTLQRKTWWVPWLSHTLPPALKELNRTNDASLGYLIEGDIEVLAISEGAEAVRVVDDALSKLYDKSINKSIHMSKSTLRMSGVLTKARLHNSIEERMKNIVGNVNLTLHQKNYESQIYPLSRQELHKLTEQELPFLFDKLKKCDKVALILPEYLCHEYQQELRSGENENVFVGKESYTEFQWMFVFERLVPPHLPQRIKSVYESGVWERWTDLVNGMMPVIVDSEENPKARAATMEGNISLIFLLLGFGESLAIIYFLLELLWFSIRVLLQ